MEIYFSVGEASGDEHAAALIREIKKRNPTCRCVGYGGDDMQAAGCEVFFPLTTMAVMGIMQVLPLLRKFWGLGQAAKKYFREHRPDAVVLVDFPCFNWWIARYAKQAGIPVYYYMPPQLWAWGGWRVKRMHKYVDHVLSGLNFETEWYQENGVNAQFVGHPFFEEVAQHPVNSKQIKELRQNQKKVIALLPGSRTMEVTMNWPAMLSVAQRINHQHPECAFLVACYKPHHREFCEEELAKYNPDLPIEFHTGKTSEIIAAADCALMVSGSVSLELMARGTPAVVLYKGGFVMGTLAKYLVKCKYMTLPNLIAGREVLPEFPYMDGEKERVIKMASILNGWLKNPQELASVRQELKVLSEGIAASKASETTAEHLLETLGYQTSVQQAA